VSACVFVGPTLSGFDVQAALPECRVLPPVQQGSIYEVVQRFSPDFIGVIDGYFQHCPSVWHKEILWAMDQRVQVLGAASMGALRAAELDPFGMIGVGKVFEAFLDGALPPFDGISDDDEVAVVHGPAETGYLSISDAMINIRFTLHAARAARVVDETTARIFVHEAKSLHFSERTYARVLARLERLKVPAETLDRLAEWLPEGKVDQKRDDALAMIKCMDGLDRDGKQVSTPSFRFEMTELFHDVLIAAPPARRLETSEREHHEAVVNELRLDEPCYVRAKLEVLVGMIMLHGQSLLQTRSDNASLPGEEVQVRERADQFRQANGLWDRESLDEWLSENDLGIAEFESLLRNDTRINAVVMSPDRPDVVAALIGHLKLKGLYSSLSGRARKKQDLLESLPHQPVQPHSLLHWYFVERSGKAVPANLTVYARGLGLAGKVELVDVLAREHRYLVQNPVDRNTDSGNG